MIAALVLRCLVLVVLLLMPVYQIMKRQAAFPGTCFLLQGLCGPTRKPSSQGCTGRPLGGRALWDRPVCGCHQTGRRRRRRSRERLRIAVSGDSGQTRREKPLTFCRVIFKPSPEVLALEVWTALECSGSQVLETLSKGTVLSAPHPVP